MSSRQVVSVKKLKKRVLVYKAMVFIIIIAVFFVGANCVAATITSEEAGVGGYLGYGALGVVGSAVSLVLGAIAFIITTVIGLLITLVVWLLVQVAQYSNIINVPTVIQGWVIVRDLCNMSFILILLIIAFATILRQENFSAKKMLPKLLLMAILINFSRTIFGLLVDFSQVIMLTFVNGFAQYGPGNFINAFQTNLLLSIKTGIGGPAGFAVTSWSTAVAIIAGVLAAIITLIVVSVMLAVLVARIVMLWIYTIFSPLVFLGFAFPPLQKYTGKIWEDFIKQLVVGPVLAFFIWLALSTASSSSNLLAGQNLTSGAMDQQICAGIGAFFCAGTFQTFIIVIGLLMGGLMVAQQMGGAAGSIAGKGLDWAKRVAGAPMVGAGKVVGSWPGWASRKMAKLSQKGGLWSLAMLGSPRTLKEGWDRRKKEDEQEAFPRASSKFQDFLNKRYNPLLGMGVEGKGRIGEKTARLRGKIESIPYLGTIARAASGKKTYNEKIAFESEVASKQSEFAKANLPAEQAAMAFHGAKGEVEKLAWTRQVTALNRQDDVARVLGKMYKIEMPGLEGRGGAFNITSWRKYLKDDYFKEFGEEKANEYLAHIAEYSEDIGKPRSWALGEYDDVTGKARAVHDPDDDPSEATALRKMRSERANAEGVAGSLEAAQFRTQESREVEVVDKVTGKTIRSIFSEMTREGKAAFQAIPTAIAEQYVRSRRVQARMVRTAGIETDPVTKEVNSDTIDYEKLAECFKLNNTMTEAMLAKIKLLKIELDKVTTNLGKLGVVVDFSKSNFAELKSPGSGK